MTFIFERDTAACMGAGRTYNYSSLNNSRQLVATLLLIAGTYQTPEVHALLLLPAPTSHHAVTYHIYNEG